MVNQRINHYWNYGILEGWKDGRVEAWKVGMSKIPTVGDGMLIYKKVKE